MLRLGPEDGPTLIGKLLKVMMHHHDLAAPCFETNAEGVCQMRMSHQLPPQHLIERGCKGLSSVLLAHYGEWKLNRTSNGWGDVMRQNGPIATIYKHQWSDSLLRGVKQ